jgi:hypothetical protein
VRDHNRVSGACGAASSKERKCSALVRLGSATSAALLQSSLCLFTRLLLMRKR